MEKYRIIIAGSRDYTDYWRVASFFGHLISLNRLDVNEIEIVSGCCPTGMKTFTREDGTNVFGADGLGERLAKELGLSVKLMPADWKKYGRSAGPIRNSEMADYATHYLIFWDGKSKGTEDMKTKAYNKGLVGWTHIHKPHNQ